MGRGKQRPTSQPERAVAGVVAASQDTPHASAAPARHGSWWRATLLLLLAFMLTGIVPVALAGQLLGVWHITLPGALTLPMQSRTGAPTGVLPQYVWIASPATVAPIETMATVVTGVTVVTAIRDSSATAHVGTGVPTWHIEQAAPNAPAVPSFPFTITA